HADMLALAKGRAADVIGLSEPTATQAEQAGYISRWKGLSELAPWYQPGFNAVSATFLQANRPAVEKLFEVTTLAGREINASNGDWTPEMLAIATKYTEQSADIIKGQGPAPYNDPNASVSVESLQKTQDAWLQQKQINQAIDVNKLADLTVMDAVIQRIGRATS
ncbi:MAG: hypothetical protein JOZ39_04465, partial [Chloroflexi bacterium]|nr:hypothetical protein [Chloroflexota bacterium]